MASREPKPDEQARGGSKLSKLVRSGSFKLGKKPKDEAGGDAQHPAAVPKKKKQKRSKAEGEGGAAKPSKASQLVRKLSIGKIYKSARTPSPTRAAPQAPTVEADAAAAARRQAPEGDDFQPLRRAEEPPPQPASASQSAAEEEAPRLPDEERIPYIEEGEESPRQPSPGFESAEEEARHVADEPERARGGHDHEDAPELLGSSSQSEAGNTEADQRPESYQTAEESLETEASHVELQSESDGADEAGPPEPVVAERTVDAEPEPPAGACADVPERSGAPDWMSRASPDRNAAPHSPPSARGEQSPDTAAAGTVGKRLEDDIAKLLADEKLSSERVLQAVEENLDKSKTPVKEEREEEAEEEEFGDNLDENNLEPESKSAPSEMPSANASAPAETNSTAQQSGDKREHLYKILVIGELGTGKTSIIKRYVHQFFSQHYRATIGVDFALKVLNWDSNSIIRLQLWDIAGQERFGNMTRVYYKEAVGAFIVFDVTRAATFDAVFKWKQDLDTKVQLPDGSPIPCVLLANKCDQQKEGLVNSPAKMDEYCKEKGFVGWYETSAKENINIEEAAKMLVTKILQNDKLIHQNDTLKDADKFAIDGKNKSEKSGKSCSC